jgi:hypothetical protein
VAAAHIVSSAFLSFWFSSSNAFGIQSIKDLHATPLARHF